MAELQGKKRKQPSSCPENWFPAAAVVQLDLTCRQERYAQRCVGIARFVYNRMVANDQAGGMPACGSPPMSWRKNPTPPNRSIRRWPSSPRSASSWPRARAGTTATPTPAGAIKASRPASRCSTGRKVLARERSWPHLERIESDMTDTGAFGCPTWAA